MGVECQCQEQHARRRVVLTGGPGAGKTAVLELLRRSVCRHVVVLPESAGILFGGGFPRLGNDTVRRAAQRAIYYVQRELEAAADASNAAVVLCDRGMVDGGAYWPGPGDLWEAVGTTREELLARYESVLHLRVPEFEGAYSRENRVRVESLEEARAVDERILRVWEGHPRRSVIEATPRFLVKAERALAILQAELPACCRNHVTGALASSAATGADGPAAPNS